MITLLTLYQCGKCITHCAKYTLLYVVLASQNDTSHKMTVHIKHVVAWVPYTSNPIPFDV